MGLAQDWREMERLQAEGKATPIGVSNYRIDDLEETLKTARVRRRVAGALTTRSILLTTRLHLTSDVGRAGSQSGMQSSTRNQT